MRALRRALIGGLGGLVLVGCAAVPDSSDVTVVRTVPDAAPPVVSGPIPGSSPFRVVRDFIEATGTPENGHAGARAFLTEDSARTWDDRRSLVVIEDSPDAAPASDPGQDQGPDAATVIVRANRIGSLQPDGSFTAETGQTSLRLNLIRENGEWRITDPPAGVLVESTAFTRNYRQAEVSFVDPNRGTLVPDVRWLSARPGATLPGRVLDLLLAGPSDSLNGAVSSAIPEGARPRSNVLVDPDGRSVIDLVGAGDLADRDRRLVAAQIVNTVGGLLPAPVTVLADGEPLVPGKVEWRVGDLGPFSSPMGPRPDIPGLVAYGNLLRGLDGEPVAGPAGSGALAVRSAATSSPEGNLLAVVVTGAAGRPELRVGQRGGGNLEAVPLVADSMSRPTWRASDNEVWTVINGNTVAGVVLSDSGTPTIYQVNAAELAELGPISELRLSRDGVRVAASIGGRLVVATVVADSGGVSLQRPRVVRASEQEPVASLDWAASGLIMMASGGATPQVATVSVDGLSYRPLLSTNLTAPLTAVIAAPGREVVVSDPNGLWAYSETQEAWEPLLGGIGSGAVPLYPG